MKKAKSPKRLNRVSDIPRFRSEQAEADFWQAHSPVEIFDQLPAADDVVFEPTAKRLVPLPIGEELYEEIRRRARRQGVAPLTLIQQLLDSVVRKPKRRTASKK